MLRQLEAKLRESVEFHRKREEKFPDYLKTKGVKFWGDVLDRLDEYRREGVKISNGQPSEPKDRAKQLNRRITVAKLTITPEIEAHTSKAVAVALKAERKRVADGLKDLELPEGTTARAAAAIKKAVKEAVAAPKE